MEEQSKEHETTAQDRRVRREANDEAMRQLVQSFTQAGMSLAAIPVNMLPEEPRQHVIGAGRELARGISALARDLADSLDRLADESQSGGTGEPD